MKIQLTILLLLLYTSVAFAQPKGKKRLSSSGTQSSQWWIGIKAGTNFTDPNATGNFWAFSFTDPPSSGNSEKMYDQFKSPGYQFGFLVGFEFMKGLSANIEPIFSMYQYSYSVKYSYASDEDQSKSVDLAFNHKNQLQYLELPLTFKYELLEGKTKPFVKGGAYISTLLNATKKTEEKITDNASGGNSIFENNEYAGEITDFYLKSNWGIQFGVGVTQNLGNARFGLEVNYKSGMKNITNSAWRYRDNQFLSGVFDAQDDIKLKAIEVSLSVVMPLKFITSKDYVPL